MKIDIRKDYTAPYRLYDLNTGCMINGVTYYDTETKEATYYLLDDKGKVIRNDKEPLSITRILPNSILVDIHKGEIIK